MLKPQAFFENMNPNNTNLYTVNIRDRYENRPD